MAYNDLSFILVQFTLWIKQYSMTHYNKCIVLKLHEQIVPHCWNSLFLIAFFLAVPKHYNLLPLYTLLDVYYSVILVQQVWQVYVV